MDRYGSRMQTSTRDRIVVAASRLLQRQGYVGTGIKQIAQEAQATLGSVYHFFPGGREAVAVTAIKHSSEDSRRFCGSHWTARKTRRRQ